MFVRGVRRDCVAQVRGAKTAEVPTEWCTDGVAASFLVFCAFGPLLALRGEVEASGRGSLHPHIEAWCVCQLLRDRFQDLLRNGRELESRMRSFIREWVNACNSMHHSSVANFPRLFRDDAVRGPLPAVTRDIVSRTRMDGGVDNVPGYHQKRRAAISASDTHVLSLGVDDPYLPDDDREGRIDQRDSLAAPRALDDALPRPAKRLKISLRGSACSSFPRYRRKIRLCDSYGSSVAGCSKPSCQTFDQQGFELCASCFESSFVTDSRLIQNRTMLHHCGPSCVKYNKDGQGICRHHVYHLVSTN